MPYPVSAVRNKGGAPPTYTISGTVYDADGTTPVSGATVAIGAASTTSAANGTYSLTGLAAGTSGSLTCTLTGYSWTAITVSAMAGNLTSQNFTNAWWAALGAGSIAAQALSPEGAADATAALVNLTGGANATNPVAPTWDAVNGWTYNGSTQYTDTGFVPGANKSYIVKYTNSTQDKTIFGHFMAAGNRMELTRRAGDMLYCNTGTALVSPPAVTSGVCAIAGSTGFANGIGVQTHIAGWTGTPTATIVLGARRREDSTTIDNFGAVKIQKWAAYNGVLTDAQVLMMTTAMGGTVPAQAWTRRGNVLTGTTGVGESTVIYEGNAQILTGNVFKMWYSDNVWGSPNVKVSYAESLDGLTWTKYGSNPVASVYRSCVLKDGSTYYLFGNDGNGHFDLLTSSDGIAWTLDTDNVLTVGGVGEWDHTSFGNLYVWKESANDWRMIYEAAGTGNAGGFVLGYATSADGRTWAKQGRVLNPTGGAGGPFVYKKGTNDYWIWAQKTDLPSDVKLYKSTDLTTWTLATDQTYAISRQGSDEGAGSGGTVSQVADVCLVEVAGTTYMFYTAVLDQTPGSDLSKIKLATVSKTMSELVTT